MQIDLNSSYDFSHSAYQWMLESFIEAGYSFATFSDYNNRQIPASHYLLLRHDVDRRPASALALARLEAKKAIRTTYFFRAKPVSFHPNVIRTISDLGHNIGYHYEELADFGGDAVLAWEAFQRNLDRLRAITPVTSIAMHGRPLSRIDNRELWQHFDYRTVGIEIEAYLDIDYKKYRYFTDTGGSWNSNNNVRDYPSGYKLREEETSIHTTFDLVSYLIQPKKHNVIISTHPERWARSWQEWLGIRMKDQTINLIKRVTQKARKF